MQTSMKVIFDFTLDELFFIKEMLGFSDNQYTALNYGNHSLKRIASLKLNAILSTEIPLNNPNKIDFRRLLAKMNVLSETDLMVLKQRFHHYSTIPRFDHSNGFLKRIPEDERLLQAGLLEYKEQTA